MSTTVSDDRGATAPAPESGLNSRLGDHTGAAESAYRISGIDDIAPFLVSLTSATDVWAFIASTGGLTAGRRNRDQALFPYVTDDKLIDAAGISGGLTLMRVWLDGADAAGGPGESPEAWGGGSEDLSGVAQAVAWEPFASPGAPLPGVRRDLVKTVLGDVLTFEEHHDELGLTLAVSWRASARLGLVRRCVLTADRPCAIELLDGLVNVLPPHITARTQNELSNLLDAYKRVDLLQDGLALFGLGSTLTDLAEPSEALAATVVRSNGPGAVGALLSTRQLARFRRGEPIRHEAASRGARGAYLVHRRLRIAAGERVEWHVIADTPLDGAQVADLTGPDAAPLSAQALAADAVADRAALTRIVASVDGLQHSADEVACGHHAANALFNAMRGGVPPRDYDVRREDLTRFLGARRRSLLEEHAEAWARLPETVALPDLPVWAAETGCPHLVRLVGEFLPLSFSRRHGDPSRPWNQFDIVLGRSDHPQLGYQGNWRDIFQNWEALAWSYPELVEPMVRTFVNATTIDGYNPYRVTDAGIDWEVPEPDDPWANIGYWSDHQIIYLTKLLELSRACHPGRLQASIRTRTCTHADVPYRIADYDDIVRDPAGTVRYDAEHATRVLRRCERIGGDGKLLHDQDGQLVLATLGEKLLLLLSAKVVNLVPGGGLWMTTQRPEWNDANNALVGRGLSVVTVAYLRRYLQVVGPLLAGPEGIEVSVELFQLMDALASAMEGQAAGILDAPATVDAFGHAGTTYRRAVYAGPGGARRVLRPEQVAAFLAAATRLVEDCLAANRRDDGLLHSYNVLEVEPASAGSQAGAAGAAAGLQINRLDLMLEGQVAALSSGVVAPEEALEMLRRLRHSALYCPVRHSYLLYPDRDLPTSAERNRLDARWAQELPLLQALADDADRSVIVRDRRGDLHFAAPIHNVRDVQAALARLGEREEYAELVQRDGKALAALFEEVFQHARFTGRSGTFFGYEGLGSVYWHMVAKLLLAVQEQLDLALRTGSDPAVVAGLSAAYEDIRSGLGYCRSPQEYGAFPTDPYSHTPAAGGARQPGMTGQVKEEILTRWAELGVSIRDGRLGVNPGRVREAEWGAAGVVEFTFCGTPMRYRRLPDSGGEGAGMRIQVQLADGRSLPIDGEFLPSDVTESLFRRDARIEGVTVMLGEEASGPSRRAAVPSGIRDAAGNPPTTR